MITNLITDILNNMTEQEKEELSLLCLNNKRIFKHLYKCSNKEDKQYEKN